MRATCLALFFAIAPPAPSRASDETALRKVPQNVGPQLQLVWLDPQRALPEGISAVAREVTAIFEELGVRVSWRIGGEAGSEVAGDATREVPVILMPTNPDPRPSRSSVMGSVQPDQAPIRCVWVYRSAVQATLGRVPRGAEDVRPYFLLRALARVVAHEVVHAIAPHEPHAAHGLMRERLDRDFLLGKRAAVDTRCASRFFQELTTEGGGQENGQAGDPGSTQN